MATSTPGAIPDALRNFDTLPDAANVRDKVVAGLFGCSVPTVWRMAKDGRLPLQTFHAGNCLELWRASPGAGEMMPATIAASGDGLRPFHPAYIEERASFDQNFIGPMPREFTRPMAGDLTASGSSQVNDEAEKQTQTSAIVKYCEERIDLFHDDNRDVFARLKETGECWRLGKSRLS